MVCFIKNIKIKIWKSGSYSLFTFFFLYLDSILEMINYSRRHWSIFFLFFPFLLCMFESKISRFHYLLLLLDNFSNGSLKGQTQIHLTVWETFLFRTINVFSYLISFFFVFIVQILKSFHFSIFFLISNVKWKYWKNKKWNIHFEC